MKSIGRKLLRMAVAELVCMVTLASVLFWMQGLLSDANQSQEMRKRLRLLRQTVAGSIDTMRDTAADYDSEYISKAAMLAYCIDHDVMTEVDDDTLYAFRDELEVDNILLLDYAGHVLAQAGPSPANFVSSRFNQLRSVLGGESGTITTSEPFDVTFSEDVNFRYYAASVSGSRVAVVEQDPTPLWDILNDTSDWGRMLNDISTGAGGRSYVLIKKGSYFVYSSQDKYTGMDALEAGVDIDKLQDGNIAWMTINGERLYCGILEVEQYWVICAITEEEFSAFRGYTVGVVLFSFFTVITSVIAYALLLVIARSRRSVLSYRQGVVRLLGLCYDRLILRKLLTTSLLGLVCIFSVSYYMQTLFNLSSTSMNNAARLNEVATTLESYQQNVDNVTEQCNADCLTKSRIVAYILEQRPELVTDEDLRDISQAIGAQYIAVFNEEASIIATDSGYKGFQLSKDPADQSYAFWALLQGMPSLVQEAQVDDVGIYRQYAGYTLRNANRMPIGFVEVAVSPDRLATAQQNLDITAVLSTIRAGDDGFAFAVDRATHQFLYHPQKRLIGQDALEHGLDESLLCSNEAGYVTLDNETYFISSMEMVDSCIYIAVPRSELDVSQLPLALASTICCFLGLLAVCLLNAEDDSPWLQAHRSGAATQQSGTGAPQNPLLRHWWTWANEGKHTPEQKMVELIKGLLGLLAVLFALSLGLSERIYGENSVIRYVLEDNWQHGANVFSFTACLMLLCMLFTGSLLVDLVLRMAREISGPRGDTICLLLRNVLKYIIVLVGLYYCLALLGVDTATLLASAGIFSVIIGLGAQNLITDILAGLFIIFEASFQVGDIITVGNCRGVVRVIGLRTTTIEDAGGDIKIINNRDLSGVVNMSRNTSYAVIDFYVPRNQPLDKIERILAEGLPQLAQKLPAIHLGPTYRGVQEINNVSMVLRIDAVCDEGDRIQLIRDLNREIKLLFDANGITC